ncbi:glycosyltransferase family 4 protein [Nocardioides sp.]|uniref:glycosyltransferase family 4 protein n=1 Tax=Nocardioides sp. TaxID=35761 RepID=UPI0031FEA429|nr:glycosyltransferase [Nocardioides sp.]
MTTPSTVYVVVPDGIDDPARPSGGNLYDRRVCSELAATGWTVHERAVPGTWPQPDGVALDALASAFDHVPEGAVVLIDGLIASAAPEVLVPEARRLRLAVLVHMPLGDRAGDGVTGSREGAALSAVAAIVTTSTWTRTWLLDRYPLVPRRVHVAEPGVDAAALARGTADGGQLICVGAVTRGKGHDVLIAALAMIRDLPWRCVCVGSLDRDPGFVASLGSQSRAGAVEDRVRFTGPLTGADLAGAYAAADLLVLASRGETYGMVVTEALARGVPVVTTAVGGVSEALGRASDGRPPGLLVPRDDPAALAAAVRFWLGDPHSRDRLRQAARDRRRMLSPWSATSDRISQVLAAVAA